MLSEPDHAHPERALVLAYAPLKARAALAALLALDDTLAIADFIAVVTGLAGT